MARSTTDAATLPFRRLLALARDLLQVPDLKSVLELVGPAFQELLIPDEALLLVTQGEQEYLTAFDRRGMPRPADQNGVLYRSARQALNDEVPLVLPGLDTSAATRPGGRPARGTACLLALPFPPVQPIGVLSALWHRKGSAELLASQASILRYLSELTGAALGSVDSRLALEERIAVTDVLTGLLNRRGFFLHAEQGFKLARRRAMASAVILADIDGLKTVNDELGHDVGDHLIQAGGRILQNSFRDSDIVARLGADEFAAFTLDSGQPEAILNRIRQNIDQFHCRSSLPCRVSFSTGIVQCDPSTDLSLADYMALADNRMYEWKRGRCS